MTSSCPKPATNALPRGIKAKIIRAPAATQTRHAVNLTGGIYQMNMAADLTPLAEATDDGPFCTPVGQVVRTVILGEPVYFTITNRRDAIQKFHCLGQFYEAEELDIIRRWFRPGSVFCDIGANIGNHSLFALKFLRASQSILFEPNPAAIAILRSNLELNGLTDRADFTNIGYGLSDTAASGLAISAPGRNMGAGKLVQGDGTLQTLRGDDALAGRHVDFIKIDVEGMELRVLGGLTDTLARCRPLIFIEVDRANAFEFKQWYRAHGYGVRARFKRYRTNENFLLEPIPPLATA